MNVYIAGPMTKFANRNYNFSSFYKAQAMLEMLGHTVHNPARMDIEEGRVSWSPYMKSIVLDPKFSLDKVMRRDITAIAQCDAIVMLPEWEDSVGARKELRVAMEDFGMPVFELREDSSGWPFLQPLE